MRTACRYSPARIFRAVVILLSPLFLCGTPASAIADTSYVSDLLVINLKSAVEQPYRVVARVRSNDPLEIIETDGDYSLVRTAAGIEGWISSQYLTDSKPKPQIIAELRSRNQELSQELERRTGPEQEHFLEESQRNLEELTRDNQNLQQRNSELIGEIEGLEQQLELLRKQLAETAAVPVAPADPGAASELEQVRAERTLLQQQNQELNVRYQRLMKQLADSGAAGAPQWDQLRRQNQELQRTVASLENKTTMYWFLAGALVFICGLIFGKIFTRKNRKFSY